MRPIDRIFALAVDKGFARDGKVSIRGLARAGGLDHSILIRARDSETGRMQQDAYEALAKALGTTVGFFLGEAAPAPSAPVGSILVPWSSLVPWAGNPRKTFPSEADHELAESIAQKGVLQNLVARPKGNMLEIGGGERRWRAIGILVAAGRWDPDAPNVPVKVVDEPDDEFLATALAENLQRVDQNPLEEAEAYALLMEQNKVKWTPSTIAVRLGASKRHVEQRLALVQRLAPEVQQAVKDGLVNFTQARFLTMAGHDKQCELVKKIDSFRTAEQLRDAITAGMVPVTRAIFDPETYAGATTVNEVTGLRYFCSKEEFLAAQKTAAQAKAEALKGEWPWAEFFEGYAAPLFNFDKGAASETRGAPAIVTYAHDGKDMHRAGAIVHFDPFDGKVTLHLGLLRREAKKEDPAAAERLKAESQAQARAYAARSEAIATFADQLQGALRADPKGALRLMLLYPALTHANRVPFDPNHAAGVTKERINGGCYSFLGRFVGPADNHGVQVLKPDADPVDVWKAALAISDKQAAEALASFAAASLTFDLHSGLGPFLAAMAEHYGVEVPAELRPAGEPA